MVDPLIELDRVSVMRGDRVILDDVSLTLPAGRHTAILGRNGAGKSTLVQLITRQLYPVARADGAPPMRIFGRSDWNVFDLRRLLGVVSPAAQGSFADQPGIEVLDAVVSSFFAAQVVWKHAVTPDMIEASRAALERMGAGHLIGRRLASLSTGEARRVMIARALVHRPLALLLDEPCAGLDPVTRWRFLEDVRGLARSGLTLLMITHHVDEVLPEIGHVVMLRDGRVIADGEKDRLLTGPVLGDLFGLPMVVERRGDWHWAHVDPGAVAERR